MEFTLFSLGLRWWKVSTFCQLPHHPGYLPPLFSQQDFHHCGWAPVSLQSAPFLTATWFSSPCTLGFPPSSSPWDITKPHRDAFSHWYTVCHYSSPEVEMATVSFYSLIKFICPSHLCFSCLYLYISITDPFLEWGAGRWWFQKPVYSLHLIHKQNSLGFLSVITAK